MVRVLALVAALVLSLGLFGTSRADDRHQGVIVVDGTQCYEVTPAGEFKPWGLPMAAGTRVSIFTVNHKWSEEWTLIGAGAASNEGCLVSKGSVEAVQTDPVPDEPEPTIEPTAVLTEEPTVAPTEVSTEVSTAVPTENPTEVSTEAPTEEPEPTEVSTEIPIVEPTETVAPTVEPTFDSEPTETIVPEDIAPVEDGEATEEMTFEQERQEEVADPSMAAVQETESPAVVPGNTVYVTTLPVTGTGSGDQFSLADWGYFIMKVILVVVGFAALLVLAVALPQSVNGWRDYKQGYDTQMSRVIRRVLGSPKTTPRKSPEH